MSKDHTMLTNDFETRSSTLLAEQFALVLQRLQDARSNSDCPNLHGTLTDAIDLLQKVAPENGIALNHSLTKETDGEPAGLLETAVEDAFCDAHCVWTNHHPRCVRAEPDSLVTEQNPIEHPSRPSSATSHPSNHRMEPPLSISTTHVLVPLVPTDDMVEAAAREGVDGNFDDFSNGVKALSRKFAAMSYTAFLTASPYVRAVPGFSDALSAQRHTYGVSGEPLTIEQLDNIAEHCKTAYSLFSVGN